jgi:tetrahydromethanopterin S-methyltransferase subunit G
MFKLAVELHDRKDSNPNDVVSWMEKAANLGHAQAQFEMGTIAENDTDAFNWYHKSAQNGCVNAKYNLGDCYFVGKGVETNYEKGFYWTEQAANDGHVKAIRKLGACYAHGMGVSVDKKKALELLNKAVSLGDDLAKEVIKEMDAESPKTKLTKHVKLMKIGTIVGAVLGVLLLFMSSPGLLNYEPLEILASIVVFSILFAFIGTGLSYWLDAFKKSWRFMFACSKVAGPIGFIFGLIIGIYLFMFLVAISPFMAIYRLIKLKGVIKKEGV